MLETNEQKRHLDECALTFVVKCVIQMLVGEIVFLDIPQDDHVFWIRMLQWKCYRLE